MNTYRERMAHAARKKRNREVGRKKKEKRNDTQKSKQKIWYAKTCRDHWVLYKNNSNII